MVSTTAARPTHYDMLGVEPDATAEEIAKAFAREIGMFRVRPVGGLAEVGVAYETLRDPARRRAYDLAMGFAPEPPKEPAVPEWAPFLMRASAHPVERRAMDPLHRPARRAEPEPQVRPEPAVDPRLAAIAASVRELAKERPAPPAPKAEPPAPKAEPPRAAPIELRFEEHEEHAPVEWKRPAMIAGGLVAAVALIGAWAGVKAGNDAQAQTLESRVTTALPHAKPASTAEDDSPLTFAEATPTRRARAVHRVQRQAPKRHALSQQELEELAPVEVGHQATDGAATPAVTERPAPVVTQAKMPLPNAVVARTIGRIGYACGSVASVVAGEGAGVYNVTCTSGHTYRAAPVRGRYHFSRRR